MRSIQVYFTVQLKQMKSFVNAFGGFDWTQFDRTLSMEFAWMVWLGSFQLNNKK